MERGAIIGGRFEIVTRAGAGGMGEVYRAIDRETGTAAAIKIIAGHREGDAGRFARVARRRRRASPALLSLRLRGEAEAATLLAGNEGELRRRTRARVETFVGNVEGLGGHASEEARQALLKAWCGITEVLEPVLDALRDRRIRRRCGGSPVEE
jgi:serine/threonine protein kinase